MVRTVRRLRSRFGRMFGREESSCAGGCSPASISTELVVVDELDRLLEAEPARRDRGGSLRRRDEARMLVCFFSFVTLTSMSAGRAFSPMIIPS